MKKAYIEKQDLVERTLLENYVLYYRLAYSYVHNEQDALDIVQTGCIKAIEKSHTLKEPRYVGTWIYRIMINSTFKKVNEQSKVTFIDSPKSQEPETSDSYTDIDLENAIENLSDRERAIIQLKYFEDFTLKEIAEILDMKESTVKSTMYRSLEKLHLDLES
ncbi:MAG: RNA polymerase sigma factor [Eubacterium sp.]|nr:RNA polymerase sigma factor [Eubacterium sp.]